MKKIHVLSLLFGLSLGLSAQSIIVNNDPVAVKGNSIFLFMGVSQLNPATQKVEETTGILEYFLDPNFKIDLKIRKDLGNTTLATFLKDASIPRKILMKETMWKDGSLIQQGTDRKILGMPDIEKVLNRLNLKPFTNPTIKLINAYEFGAFSILEIEYRQLKDNDESKYTVFVPSNNDISGMLNAEW